MRWFSLTCEDVRSRNSEWRGTRADQRGNGLLRGEGEWKDEEVEHEGGVFLVKHDEVIIIYTPDFTTLQDEWRWSAGETLHTPSSERLDDPHV